MSYPRIFAHSFFISTVVFLVAPVGSVEAHNGGIILQMSQDKVVTGYDNESGGVQTIGDRSFSLLFPPSLANDIPSFISFASAPAGSDPLPGGMELYWDFLPMTYNGLTSNLLYWDGIGTMQEDVQFGAIPQDDVTLSLYTEGFADHAEINGDPEMVPGFRLGTVSSSGSNLRLHAHRWWFMDSDTSVPDGVYLMSLQVRTPAYDATDPFYVLASKDANALDIALPWVESEADLLILEGDYNFDGLVDGFDFLVWQRQHGLQQQYPNGPFPVDGAYADGDGNNIVGAGDLAQWEANFGPPPSPLAAALDVVPEPSSMLLAVVCASSLLTPRLVSKRGVARMALTYS